MRTLPLYPDAHQTPLETASPLARNEGCRLCPLGGTGRRTCLGPDFVKGPNPERGTILVIGADPTNDDLRSGRVMSSGFGNRLRKLIKTHWEGRVAFDNVVKCGGAEYPKKPNKKFIPPASKCIGYLRATVEAAQPDRILVFGRIAAKGVLGRHVEPMDVRGNYSWIKLGARKIPLFVLMDVEEVSNNKVLRRWLEEDIKYALNVPLDKLMPPIAEDAVFHIVETEEDALYAADKLREQEWFSWDTEFAGRPYAAFFKVKCVSLTPGYEDTAYVWGRHAMEDPACTKVLCDLVEDRDLGKSAHHGKTEGQAMRAAFGVIPRGNIFDTQLARKMEFPGVNATLETCSELIGMGGYKQRFESESLGDAKVQVRKAREKAKKSGNRQLWLVDNDPVLQAALDNPHEDVEVYAYGLVKTPYLERYNACDTVATARITRSKHGLRMVREVPHHRTYWRGLQGKMSDAVEQMEAWGMPVSKPACAALKEHIDRELSGVLRRFEKYKVSPSSTPQLQELLFHKLKLRNPQDKPGRAPNFSTDKYAMKAMRDVHPIIADIQEFRRLDTHRKNWSNLAAFIRADGRIHPSLKIDGTETGRASCVDPPLHGAPRPEDGVGHTEGKLIRSCFAAEPGYRIRAYDYSQLEYRVAAILSGDQVMKRQFLEGGDIHLSSAKYLSQILWGITADQVGKAQRSETKTVNFALLYGKVDATIADELGVSIERAGEIRAAIMGAWVDLDAWIKDVTAYGYRTGQSIVTLDLEPALIRQIWQIGYEIQWSRDLTPRQRAQREEQNSAKNSCVNCLDDKTEALTQRGWVPGFELRSDDVLLTKNINTEAFEWQGMTDLKLYPDYEGPLVEFEHKSFSAVSTPDHRWMVTRKSDGKTVETTTQAMSRHGDHRIHRTGDYQPRVASDFSGDEAELLGWVLTDGVLRRRAGGSRGPKVTQTSAYICQSFPGNPEKCARIEDLLSRNGWLRRDYTTKSGEVFWRLTNDIATKLWTYCPDRVLTHKAMLSMDRPALERLFEAMILGDGTTEAHGRQRFCTGKLEQAEAFQMLCLLVGRNGRIKRRDMTGYKIKDYASIPNQPKGTVYYEVKVLTRPRTQVTGGQRREYIARTPVWCPMVPNTFFVARRNGHVFVTGNTPCQGTGALIMNRAISRIVPDLVRSDIDAKLCLTVHDSVIFECREGHEDKLDDLVFGHMLNTKSRGVPIVVDVDDGEDWGNLKNVGSRAAAA